MRRTLTIIISFAIVNLAVCQSLVKEIKSLKLNLNSEPSDLLKIRKLNGIGELFNEVNPDSAISYGHKALLISGSKAEETRSFLVLANAFNLSGNEDSAAYYLGRIESEPTLTGLNEVRYYLYLGTFLFNKNQYDSAISKLYNSLRLAEEIDLVSEQLRVKISIAACLDVSKRRPESKELYLSGLNMALEIMDSVLIGKFYNGLGILLFRERDYEGAVENLEKSIDIKLRTIGVTLSLAKTYGNIASAYSRLKNYKAAELFFDKALGINLKYGLKRSIAANYNNLGLNFERQGRIDKALKNYHFSESISKSVDAKVLRVALTNLYYGYKAKHDYKRSLEYFEKFYALSDSLFTLEKEKQIEEIRSEYEFEKKSLAIENLTIKNELADQVLQDTNGRFRLFAIITLLILLLIVFYAVSAYRINKKNKKLNLKKIDDLLQQREINSLQGVLAGQEEERQRIATDLHDKLGAILGMVKLHFSAVEDRIDDLRDDNKKQYNKANELLDQASTEVRNISHNLLSGVLVKFGLIPALRDLKDTVEATGKLKIKLITGDQMEIRLKGEQELQIYRIVQELISNILKHAKATEAVIQLNRTNGEINLIVEDNGVGFDVEAAKQKSGIGLKNMEARAAKLSAIIHFDSGKGAGTTVSIDIPVEKDIL